MAREGNTREQWTYGVLRQSKQVSGRDEEDPESSHGRFYFQLVCVVDILLQAAGLLRAYVRSRMVMRRSARHTVKGVGRYVEMHAHTWTASQVYQGIDVFRANRERPRSSKATPEAPEPWSRCSAVLELNGKKIFDDDRITFPLVDNVGQGYDGADDAERSIGDYNQVCPAAK